jgi:hypothetical protein
MSYTAPDISSLSAHEYNKIRQSYDSYNKLQTKTPYSGAPRHNPNRVRSIAANKAAKARAPHKRGSYGIEDEYRYMVSQGYKPAPSAAAPAPPAADPRPKGPTTGPVDPPSRLPVGNQRQQSTFDPMAMMMLPLLLEALKPKPVPVVPEPTTYASAGQAAKSAPGVKVKRSEASKNRQNTMGTRGTFNRNDLRISNLNI